MANMKIKMNEMEYIVHFLLTRENDDDDEEEILLVHYRNESKKKTLSQYSYRIFPFTLSHKAMIIMDSFLSGK